MKDRSIDESPEEVPPGSNVKIFKNLNLVDRDSSQVENEKEEADLRSIRESQYERDL